MVGSDEGERLRLNRIEGELISTFSDIENEYDCESLELAFMVTKALLGHVYRTKEPYQVLEFCQKHSDILGEQARLIEECFKNDRLRQLN